MEIAGKKRTKVPVIEILGDDIISGKFNTHRISIEEDKDPCPIVGDGIPQYLKQQKQTIIYT